MASVGVATLDALVRRMSKAYHERRQVMDAALNAHGLTIAGQGAYGGSSVWLRAPTGTNTTELAQRLRADNVLVEPGAPFFAGETPPTEYLRLAYSSIPSARIQEGIRLIANAISST